MYALIISQICTYCMYVFFLVTLVIICNNTTTSYYQQEQYINYLPLFRPLPSMLPCILCSYILSYYPMHRHILFTGLYLPPVQRVFPLDALRIVRARVNPTVTSYIYIRLSPYKVPVKTSPVPPRRFTGDSSSSPMAKPKP